MSIFSVMAFIANGVAAMVAGWIEVDSRLGWRWIQWIHLMYVHSLFCEKIIPQSCLELNQIFSFIELLVFTVCSCPS